MKELIASIIINIMIIGSAFGIFSFIVMLKVLAGSFYNVRKEGQQFKLKKFFSGILQMIIMGLISAGIGVAVALIQAFVQYLNAGNLSDTIKFSVSITTVVLAYAELIQKYFNDVINTWKKIANTEDFAGNIIEYNCPDEEIVNK